MLLKLNKSLSVVVVTENRNVVEIKLIFIGCRCNGK